MKKDGQNAFHLICEVKKASPSKGIIRENFQPVEIAKKYEQGGASAISVLTDEKYFMGRPEYLREIKKIVSLPVLRKDFIIDEYQIIEAKSIGADCILLIASILNPKQIKSLAAFAKRLGLEVLIEVRTKEEIDAHCNEHIDLIGVNNRDLTNFTTHISNSLRLFEYLPKELVKISESGISKASQIQELNAVGYDGFLIGNYFMKHEEPGRACKNLIDNYYSISK